MDFLQSQDPTKVKYLSEIYHFAVKTKQEEQIKFYSIIETDMKESVDCLKYYVRLKPYGSKG